MEHIANLCRMRHIDELNVKIIKLEKQIVM